MDANDTAMAGLDANQQEAFHRTLIHILANLETDEAEAEARGQRIPPTRGLAL